MIDVAVGSPSMIGETLGTYRIVSELGHGGMGVVYLAEHTLIGKKVAIKLLRSDVAQDQVERFFNEARAAAKVHHPNLVEVIDFGQADDRAFIVMEFLAGESLAERLDREPKLPVELACTIARSVASALRAAHDEGIIHRDLKPGNIFLVTDPDSPGGVRVKVLDFGIAKLTRDAVPSAVMTNSGAVIGTPRYMSPEQCRNARAVDGRTDIYSLGCILYEMLVGTPPFDYDNWAELVGAHLHEEPAKPTELDAAMPAVVEELVLKMTAKKVEQRHASMNDVVAAIDQTLLAIGSEPGRSMPIRTVPSSPSLRRLATPARGARASKTEMDPTMLSPDPKPDSKSQPKPVVDPAPTTLATRRSPLPLILGLVGLVIAGAVIVVVVVLTRTPPAEVQMVHAEPQKRTDLVVEPPAAPVQAKTVEPVAAPPVTPKTVAKPKTPDEELIDKLTAKFATRRAAVKTCFDTPSSETISVRLQIDRAGKVIDATVSPAAVAATPAGACLAKVARETAFGPQPKAVVFHVPITAR